MKKNFLLVIILVLFITGCGKNSTEKEYTKTISCSALNSSEVKFIDSGKTFMFVTSDNKIYELNLDKKYSKTDENCEEFVKTSHQLKGISGNFLYDENNDLVDVRNYGKNANIDDRWSKISQFGDVYDYNYDVMTSSIYLKDSVYYLRENNNKINFSLEDDEYIKTYYDIWGDSFIKTNKAIYQLKKKKTNKEECEKYADVKCKYEYTFEKNDIFSQYLNDIVMISLDQNVEFKGDSDWFYVIYLKDGTSKAIFK